jgi:hypothetical protein
MERSPPRPIDSPIDREDEANAEQREPDQAQDVAADAMRAPTDLSEDSERGGHPDRGLVAPQDTPDLVEMMDGMVRSGRVDTGAFSGEPEMDDEEDELGRFEDKHRPEDYAGEDDDDGTVGGLMIEDEE